MNESGYIRGGPWSHTEDQIVLAAIQKYGLNQWSRISSLLRRRSAQQCKARWYEFLDPALKKGPWSDRDDKKLLGLCKQLPQMWRTIAPMMGRSAQECLERYHKLLIGSIEGAKAGALEETMPTRDHNQDETSAVSDYEAFGTDEETEMVAEARARLANSLGKKAKRKLREKVEAQNKRLRMLEEHRESGKQIKLSKSYSNAGNSGLIAVEITAPDLVAPEKSYDVHTDDARDLSKRVALLDDLKHSKSLTFGSKPIASTGSELSKAIEDPDPNKSYRLPSRRSLEFKSKIEITLKASASKSTIKRIRAALQTLPEPSYPRALESLPTRIAINDSEFSMERPSEADNTGLEWHYPLPKAIRVLASNNDILAPEIATMLGQSQRVKQLSLREVEYANRLVNAELESSESETLSPDVKLPVRDVKNMTSSRASKKSVNALKLIRDAQLAMLNLDRNAATCLRIVTLINQYKKASHKLGHLEDAILIEREHRSRTEYESLEQLKKLHSETH